MLTPISSHVSIKPMARLGGRTESALPVIDSVHRDGKLGAVKIFGWKRPIDECGLYRTSNNIIRLNTLRDDHEFTIVHEIGHVIAIQGLGGGKFVCDHSPQLGAWRKAIRASDEHKGLKRMKKTGVRQLRTTGGIRNKPLTAKEMEHVEYLLLWEELWARSYSEFIALTSGDATLLKQLRDEAEARNERFFYTYWPETSFGDIRDAILDVLKNEGWM